MFIELIDIPTGTATPWSNRLAAPTSQGASNYGPILVFISSTQVDIRFRTNGVSANNATYAGNGNAFSTLNSAFRWRVAKKAGVAATALSEAVPGVSNGFLSFNGVKGFTDGSSATAGYVGEVLNGTVTSVGSSITTAVEKEFASISLTAGVWMVYGQIHATTTGTPGADGVVQAGLSDAGGSTVNGDFLQSTPQTRTSGGGIRLSAPPRYFSISSTQTIKIFGTLVFTTSTHTVGANSKIYAVRIR